MVEDVGQAVDRNVTGAKVLQELLSAPWLRALLKVGPGPRAGNAGRTGGKPHVCLLSPDLRASAGVSEGDAQPAAALRLRTLAGGSPSHPRTRGPGPGIGPGPRVTVSLSSIRS